jgi:2-dehydro-3-deoxy-D-arabinonate dehydratase
MQLCKIRQADGIVAVARFEHDQVHILDTARLSTNHPLSHLLHAPDLMTLVRSLTTSRTLPANQVQFLAPVDEQEVWAAGVTYKRSKVAREEESATSGASRFYDLVYSASRPELFFKSSARRVIHPGDPVRIRRDARWSVPEPEFALVISPKGNIVGFTIGNDMSSRDIEGENPLYLPQAKIYDGSCSLGPVITLANFLGPLEQTTIQLTILRGSGNPVFTGSTSLAMMARSFDDLVAWLTRETSFPDGVVLLTGTGIVPPDDFTLAVGDEILIEIAGIGQLVNRVGE